MKKLNNNIARPLLLATFATALIAGVQYLFDGKINEQVLNHVAPVSIAAYLIGLHYGRHEQTESKKNDLKKTNKVVV